MRRFVIVALVLGASVASADTIEEKRLKEQAEKSVAHEIKSMNTKCKTTVAETGIIDWSSWKVIADDNSKAEYSCKYVPYGIYFLCNSDKIAQETVAKNIKKMVCKGDATDDINFEMKGDTLIVHTMLGAKDTDKKTKKWLTKNLQ